MFDEQEAIHSAFDKLRLTAHTQAMDTNQDAAGGQKRGRRSAALADSEEEEGKVCVFACVCVLSVLISTVCSRSGQPSRRK